MIDVLIGLVILIATAALLWTFMPRNGKPHRIAESAWDTYVGVGITSGIGVGSAMVIAGAVQLFS